MKLVGLKSLLISSTLTPPPKKSESTEATRPGYLAQLPFSLPKADLE